MKHAPEPPSSLPIPITSSSGLPIAIVNANPRNATPSTEPSISAECALSMGSKNMVLRSSAMLVRIEKLTPAVSRATTLRKNIRGLLYSACLSTAVLSWVDIVILDSAGSGQYTMILPVRNLQAFARVLNTFGYDSQCRCRACSTLPTSAEGWSVLDPYKRLDPPK